MNRTNAVHLTESEINRVFEALGLDKPEERARFTAPTVWSAPKYTEQPAYVVRLSNSSEILNSRGDSQIAELEVVA